VCHPENLFQIPVHFLSLSMCGYLDAEFTYFLLFLHKIEAQIHKAIYWCWQKKQYEWEVADARNPHLVKPQFVKDCCI